MNKTEVYLWLKLTTIGSLISVVGWIGTVIGGIVFGLITAIHGIYWFWFLYPIFPVLFIVGFLCPTTEEYAVIKILPEIVNSKVVKDTVLGLPADICNVYKMVINYLKNRFEE